jgi:L,D-peptidoglycan transpeptidase YkuD (ErfK/YbiS/YcfS/YnhG family)
MVFAAWPDGSFDLDGELARCAVGRSGVILARDKREGDGASPAGSWAMRRLLYRADRMARPRTDLPAFPLAPDDGWCDGPDDKAYNRPVKLPYPGRAEILWREDSVYDLIVVLAYNDEPVRKGRGSAIFLHLARPDYSPTEGCVALARRDMERLLAKAAPGSALIIHK